MNCRRVCGLLSAYLDSELTREEMAGVREHLGECPVCRREYQSLAETKHLLASLAHRASRAEIEALLQSDTPSPRPGPLGGHRYLLRPRPLAATALLSVAGLWLATTALDRGSPDADDAPPTAATLNAGVFATPFASPSFIRSAIGAPPAAVVSFPVPPPAAGPATPVLLPASGAAAVTAAPGNSLLGVSASAEMPLMGSPASSSGRGYYSVGAAAAAFAPSNRGVAPGAVTVYYVYPAAPASSLAARESFYLSR